MIFSVHTHAHQCRRFMQYHCLCFHPGYQGDVVDVLGGRVVVVGESEYVGIVGIDDIARLVLEDDVAGNRVSTDLENLEMRGE